MSGPGQEFVELFLQEASEHLQFLREYSGALLDPYPVPQDIERLYIAAHGLGGTAGTYGYKSFSEVTGKLAHIFQYAMNSTIGPDACSPLVEFIYEAIAVLESDLLMISANGVEAEDDVKSFKQRYPFAFQQPVDEPEEQAVMTRPLRRTETGEEDRVEPSRLQWIRLALRSRRRLRRQANFRANVQRSARRRTACGGSCTSAVAQDAPLPGVAETPRKTRSRCSRPSAETFEASGPDEAIEPGVTTEESLAPEPLSAAEEPLPLEPVALETQNVFETSSLQNVLDLEAQAAQAFAPSLLDLPPDDNVAPEVLEFFVPEVEEHLQSVTESLLSLEANPNPEDINKLFRAMHTIKGSAAQVGFHRLSAIAHRAEDLIARLRDGELKPSANIVDLCLESVDLLKKQLYRQWSDEQSFQDAALAYFQRIDQLEDVEAEILEQEAEEVAEKALAAEGQMPVEAVAEPVAEVEPEPRATNATKIAALAAGRREPAGVPQSKSVRIALERLDRMMNAVGELVINRTRMLGRLEELEQLADVLNFSKGAHDRQGSRIPGEVRIQPHQLLRRSRLPDTACRAVAPVPDGQIRAMRSSVSVPRRLLELCARFRYRARRVHRAGDGSLRRFRHPLAFAHRNFRRHHRGAHATRRLCAPRGRRHRRVHQAGAPLAG